MYMFGNVSLSKGPARSFSSKDTDKVDESPRLREFRKKLRERAPIGMPQNLRVLQNQKSKES